MASLGDDEFLYLDANGLGFEVVNDEVGDVIRQSFDQTPLPVISEFEQLVGDGGVIDRLAQVVRCRRRGEGVVDGQGNEQFLGLTALFIRNANAVLHFKVFNNDLIHTGLVYDGCLPRLA